MKNRFAGVKNLIVPWLLLFVVSGCNTSHMRPPRLYGGNQSPAYFTVSSSAARRAVQKPKSLPHSKAWYSVKEVSGAHTDTVVLNDQGDMVTSVYYDFRDIHNFYWRSDKATIISQGSTNHVIALNNQGKVLLLNNDAAYLWQAGRLKPLSLTMPLPLPQSRFIPIAMNNNGLIVGDTASSVKRLETGDITLTVNASHAFLWQAGGVKDLGAIPSAVADSHPHAINDKNQIVGDSGGHAFLWQRGKMTDLGVLPGYTSSSATALNRKGQIVGVSNADQDLSGVTLGDAYGEPFLWENGVMHDLGSLPGGNQNTVVGVDGKGQVLGQVHHTGINQPDNPVLWCKGNIYDLNDLIPKHPAFTLVWPKSINQRGQIVCSGFWTGNSDPGVPTGDNRYYLLTPTLVMP